MDKFVSSIKTKYSERLINSERQWPTCHSSKLVQLDLVEKSKGYQYLVDQPNKGMPLHFGDVFAKQNAKRPVRKVLVEGSAGTGKTTLCTSASEEWANGKLFEQFELLLLLPLRQKSVASAGSISGLLKLLHSSPAICDTVAHYLEEKEGKKVLIIADGWDELSESNRQEDSFLYKFFFETFPLMSVLLTSRPSAATLLHGLPCIDRYMELQGFSKENVEEYIHSEFSYDDEKACRLLIHLHNSPLVESVCTVPLNCTIVCHLWRTLEEALPTTLTELYTKIVLNVVLRNIRKLPGYGSITSLSSFDALPKSLKQAWWQLCEFAFHTIEKDQTTFSKEELAQIFPQRLFPVILGFGLVQSTEFIFDTGRVQSFQFMHLTFQEYLSALHLLRQSSKSLVQIIDSMNLSIYMSPYCVDSYPVSASFNAKLKRFSIIWQVFFGAYFSKSILKCNLDVQIVIRLLTRISMSPFNLQLICNCAFEAKNELINEAVIRSISNSEYSILTGQIFCYGELSNFNFGHPQTLYDCSAVINIIYHMNKCGCLMIDFSHCGISDSQIRSLTDVLASKHGKLQIVSLNLSGNNLSDNSISDLFCRASASFRMPASLDFSNNVLGVQSIKSVTAALKTSPQSLSMGIHSHNDSDLLELERIIQMNPSSLTLYLSQNPLGSLGILALESAIRDNSLHNLQCLYLEGTLTGDANKNAQCLKSLFEACFQQLTYLNISHNDLGVPGASALSTFFRTFDGAAPEGLYSYRKVRTQIELGHTKLRDEGLIALVESAKNQCDVFELGLSSNSIHTRGVSFLADVICSGKLPNLFGLHLDDNPLFLQGTIALAKIISSGNHSLSSVTISKCQLTTAQAENMYTCTHTATQNHEGTNQESTGLLCEDIQRQLCQMPLNYSISSLHLNNNSFTGAHILILAGFMHLCQSLRYIATNECGITMSDLRQLIGRLTELKSSLPSTCSELREWDLMNNDIDDDGLSTLVDHIPSLFPKLNYKRGLFLEGNLISPAFTRTLEIKLSQDSLALPQVTNTRDGKNIQWTFKDNNSITMHFVEPRQEYHTPADIKPEFQTKWEETVSLMYDSAMDMLICSPLNLVPVKEDTGRIEADDQQLLQDEEFEVLNTDDLASVQRAVWEGRAKWYNIGLELGLTAGTLDAIQLSNHYNIEFCFTATLKEWLRGSELHPSWVDLDRALRAPTVGLNALAEQIVKTRHSK